MFREIPLFNRRYSRHSAHFSEEVSYRIPALGGLTFSWGRSRQETAHMMDMDARGLWEHTSCMFLWPHVVAQVQAGVHGVGLHQGVYLGRGGESVCRRGWMMTPQRLSG